MCDLIVLSYREAINHTMSVSYCASLINKDVYCMPPKRSLFGEVVVAIVDSMMVSRMMRSSFSVHIYLDTALPISVS